MQALSIHPEWLWAVRYLDKDVENRSWYPPRGMIGQPLLLHATREYRGGVVSALVRLADVARRAGWRCRWTAGQVAFVRHMAGGRQAVARFEALPRDIVPGSIVGAATLAAVTRSGYSALGWREPNHYHWHLVDVRWLRAPVPVRGRQLLWRVEPRLLPPVVRREIGYENT